MQFQLFEKFQLKVLLFMLLFAVILPKQHICSLSQNPQALAWRWRQGWTFKIKYSFSQCTNISKQGIFVHVNHQGLFSKLFWIHLVSILVASPDQICCIFPGTPSTHTECPKKLCPVCVATVEKPKNQSPRFLHSSIPQASYRVLV